MTFEEALRTELSVIPELSSKIYPLFAPKDTKPPYLVYRRGLTEFEKTLSGISKPKVDGTYTLVLVSEDYSELQNISTSVINALISFLGRQIGNNGPYITNLTAKITGDFYEPEIDKFRCDMELNVKFKEV